MELEKISISLQSFINKNRDGAILIFSDHGHSNIRKYIRLPKVGGVVPIGESRVGFYRLSISEVEDVLEHVKNSVEVMHVKEIYPIYSDKVRRKYGETVVLAKDGYGFLYPFEKAHRKKLSGHGGMSSEEILVNVWKHFPA